MAKDIKKLVGVVWIVLRHVKRNHFCRMEPNQRREIEETQFFVLAVQ